MKSKSELAAERWKKQLKSARYWPGLKSSLRIQDLFADMLADCKRRGLNSTRQVQRLWELHLMLPFGSKRACDLNQGHLFFYIDLRLHEGASNASINKELGVLRAMFTIALGAVPPKVDRIPRIPKLQVAVKPRPGKQIAMRVLAQRLAAVRVG